jgi:hypothetical protein
VLFAAEADTWSLQGVRPANHPSLRLGQYAVWTRARPDWPELLVRFAERFPTFAPEDNTRPTAVVRRQCGLSVLRARLAREITTDAIGGTRLDNLVCDGFLPLLAARVERNLFPLWFHWFVGDLPPRLGTILRSLAIFDGHAQPACHGLAQGLFGWMLAREAGVPGA